MKESTKIYFNNLDATRFISFIFIFLSHVFYTKNLETAQLQEYQFIDHFFKTGRLGLDYFFVLSSFLITWIIFEEYQQTKGFKITFFWIRRSLRIWPLYFFIVLLGYLSFWVNTAIFKNSSETLPPVYQFIFFTINFYIIHNGQHFLFFLVFLWSVAVEEQFYFFWALILKYLKSYFVFVCFMLLGVSVFFRVIHLNDPQTLYFHSISILGSFVMGSLVAYISFHKTIFFNWLCNLPKNAIAGIYLLIVLNIIYHQRIYSYGLFNIAEKLIFSIFFGFIIVEQSFCKNSLIKLGKWKSINYLGKISYGLYCYHGVVITVFIKIAQHYFLSDDAVEVFFINPLIIAMFTVALAVISYELLEKKIVKLKNRFYSR